MKPAQVDDVQRIERRNAVFVVDRSGNVPLHEQLYRQLRDAITSGIYRPGDTLPTFRDLAQETGVGGKTSRRALLRLAAEGWTTMRPHIGSIVSARGVSTLLRKRILLFTPLPFFSYYPGQFLASMRERLASAGTGVSVVLASGFQGEDDFRQLSERLAERWDLIVEMGYAPKARTAIEESGWPFLPVSIGGPVTPSRAPNCVGTVDIRSLLAIFEFIRDCIRKRMKSVLLLLSEEIPNDAAEMLAVAGINTKTILFGVLDSPEAVTRAGFKAMRDFFADKRNPRPDVILFADDYIAQGGLMALLRLDVGVPKDVAVATLANKGHGPVWEKPLTRLEMDPNAHGASVADAIAAFLDGRPFPGNFVLGSVYRSGETF